MNEYLDALIARYRSRGVLIDANLLILYFVGEFDVRQISRFRRTREYQESDYRLLKAFLELFPVKVTTPNILTEVSNLSRDMPGWLRDQFFERLRAGFELLTEEYQPSSAGAADPIFVRLGLADAVITQIAPKRYLVMTDDFPLSNYLAAIQADVVNINHLRFSIL